jgi:predicted RNA-binding protein YlqC (UPF0109 family)
MNEEQRQEEVDWLVNLTKDIVEGLVDNADNVTVKTKVKGHILLMTIDARNGELGKVIGKKGQTIDAIRVLLQALVGGQKRMRVIVETVDRKKKRSKEEVL